MINQLLRLVEVLGLRAGPGLLNLSTLLFLATWLGISDYGIYSTIVVTAGFVASLTFGPLTFAVVSQHAQLEAKGLADIYESSLVSAFLLIAAVVGSIGALAATLELIAWAWIAPAVTFGIYQALQAILQARLRFWSYGAAGLTQATVFLVLAWCFVRPEPAVGIALTALAISYAVAAVVSVLLSGLPQLRWPKINVLAGTLRVGGPYTLSKIAENGLSLGFRYLILLVGTTEQLGIFSFCVDLAQRLIGFLINAARFVAIPAAFKADAEGNKDGFHRTLLTGAILSMGLATASLVAVFVIRKTGWVTTLNGELLDPIVFVIVSAAVVLNQLKKTVVDPIAMRIGKTIAIAIGYGVSAPLTLAFGMIALTVHVPWGAELTYLGGYSFAALVTVVALRWWSPKQQILVRSEN